MLTSISCEMLKFQEIDQGDFQILKAGTEKSGHDPVPMAQALMDGTAIMWRVTAPGARGVIITQENEYRGKKALFLWYLCGTSTEGKVTDQGTWPEALKYYQKTLEEFARLRGLEVMWAKAHPKQYGLVSKPAGWKIDEFIISKEV